MGHKPIGANNIQVVIRCNDEKTARTVNKTLGENRARYLQLVTMFIVVFPSNAEGKLNKKHACIIRQIHAFSGVGEICTSGILCLKAQELIAA